MLQILFTLILLAIVIYGIVKKINIATVLLFATIIGYLCLTIAGGTSVAGEESIGNRFLDIFEIINSSMVKAMTGNILTAMVMISYMDHMKELKATDMFATILAAPVQKWKSKYLVAAFTIPIGVLMGIAISGGSFITMTLLLGTIYPVLRALGCSKPTCATAILLHTVVLISPARAAYYNALSLMEMEASVPLWFVQIQLPVAAVMVIVMMILFVITSKYFDKKEGRTEEARDETLKLTTIRDIDAPVIYGILPLLPLILVVIFSELVVKSVVISVVAACILSWIISFIVNLIATRNLMDSLKRFNSIYKGMGTVMTTTGPILMFGTTFAGVISAVGGMSILIDSVSRVASGEVLLALVGLTGLVMVALTGTFNGNLALVFPIVKEIVASTGIGALGAAQGVMLTLTAGGGLCPVSGQNLFLAQQTDTDILVILKRGAIPIICGAAAQFLVSVLIFG